MVPSYNATSTYLPTYLLLMNSLSIIVQNPKRVITRRQRGVICRRNSVVQLITATIYCYHLQIPTLWRSTARWLLTWTSRLDDWYRGEGGDVMVIVVLIYKVISTTITIIYIITIIIISIISTISLPSPSLSSLYSLVDMGIERSTLVVVTSDNGPEASFETDSAGEKLVG